ncbi:MAG: hypothetical protein AAF640_03385 [Pseudomonadota bacterium]
MKQAGLIAAAVLAATALVYLQRDQGGGQGGVQRAQPALPESAEPRKSAAPPQTADGAADAVASSKATPDPVLASELQAALGELAAAESALRDSERDVAELEAIIDDIRSRGEDPADNFSLAVEKFQPAFFRFQDAAAAYEEAQQRVDAARAAMRAGG